MYVYYFGQLVSQCLKGGRANLGLVVGRSVHSRGPSGVEGGSSMRAMQQTCEYLCCLPRFPSVVDVLSGGMGTIQRGMGLAILILLSMPV